MKISRFSRAALVNGPWLFSIVSVLVGLALVLSNAQMALHAAILIGTGLVCMSLYCVCALLSDVLEALEAKDKAPH